MPHATKMSANIASGGFAGSLSLTVVYSLDYARTRLANDSKGKDGKRQYNGLIDVYKKTIASDGIAGLYRGFAISCVGIFIYRGLYFGIYDTVKPIFIGEGGSFMASFLLGWAVTVASGTGVHYKSSIDCGTQIPKTEGFMSMMKGAGA